LCPYGVVGADAPTYPRDLDSCMRRNDIKRLTIVSGVGATHWVAPTALSSVKRKV